MADNIGPAFHVSRVGLSSQFGGDTFTIKAHFHTREQAELAKVFLEQHALARPGDDKQLLELIGEHCLLRDETEGRWFFNFPGLRKLITAAGASPIAGVGDKHGG
jgi:hypothetical protein